MIIANDSPGVLAATTAGLHENDLSSRPSAGIAERRAAAFVGGDPMFELATTEAGEAARGPLGIIHFAAALMRPGLSEARAKLGSPVALAWIPRLAGAARSARIALARAEANAVRVEESMAKAPLATTGDPRLDALARLDGEIVDARLDAWALLAELRTAVCIYAQGCKEVSRARSTLAYQLQRLGGLTSRRRQAQRDGGDVEVRLRRSERASDFGSLYEDRAECHEQCIPDAPDQAEYELVCIMAALNRYRADAWYHLADFHKAHARGAQLDLGAVADLRHCRVRIAELNADLPRAVAASEAAAEAERMRWQLDHVAAGVSQAPWRPCPVA